MCNKCRKQIFKMKGVSWKGVRKGSLRKGIWEKLYEGNGRSDVILPKSKYKK